MQPAIEPGPGPVLHEPEAGETRFDGWRVVGAGFLSQGVAIGVTFSGYSLFVEPVEAELGATRLQTNAGMSILMLVAALIAPLLGRVIDRGPVRAVMLTGVLCTALGLVLLSQASGLLQLALVLSLVIGVGHSMFGPLPAITIVANWFVARRGTAIGISSLGTTFAGFVVPPVAALLITRYTWRGALLAYAAGTLVIALPAIWLWVVKRPEDVGQFPDGQRGPEPTGAEASAGASGGFGSVLRSTTFWLLVGIFGLMSMSTIALITNLVPFASDLGIARSSAALVLSCQALCACAGKLAFGMTFDRIDHRAALGISLGIGASGWAILIFEPGFGALMLAGSLIGFSMGALMPGQGAIIGAVFGRSVFGQAMGLMGPFTLVFTVATPPAVGYLYQHTGGYTLPFALLLGAFALPAVLLLFLRLPGSDSEAR